MKLLRRRTFNGMKKRLAFLYGHERLDELSERLYMLIGRYGLQAYGGERGTSDIPAWDEKDAVLITYGDMVSTAGEPPLATLKKFCDMRLAGALNTVHLLPFYPYSSDGGFSVIDYREVEPTMGSWKDVDKLHQSYNLMYDLVLNHCSASCTWFDKYSNGTYPYKNYFIEGDPNDERLSLVTRPRPWPLLTKVDTSDGEKHVWTTFSEDQIDLNFACPDVLFEFLDILLDYIAKGARIIRLDAVAFLWKELGTNCIHLEQTHQVVKLMRDILKTVSPETILLTETNVPHEENISYFGEGDEAHMVYNFALPPLLLHSLLSEDATYLKDWAQQLPPLPEGCTYFNFTASHDGIGVRALSGLVPDDQLDWLLGKVAERNGLVSYRAMPDGSKTPYELNITYRDAMDEPGNDELGVRRFLCSQAIMLGLQGIPGIYFQSIIGARNWTEGPELEGGENRDINRQRWDFDNLNRILDSEDKGMAWIHSLYVSMLLARNSHPAFHPNAKQEVLESDSKVFAFKRSSIERPREVLCLHNVSSESQEIDFTLVTQALGETTTYRDILGRQALEKSDSVTLAAYQTLWLECAERVEVKNIMIERD